MHAIMHDQQPPAETPRGLHEICEDTRRAPCPLHQSCGALAGDECVFTTVPASLPVTKGTKVLPARGYHVGRLAAAETAGLITVADFAMALDTLKGRPFDSYTVIFDVENTMTTEDKPIGPFDTEREARVAAHAAVPPRAGRSILSAQGNRQLLGRALQDAGVSMGRYDDRIVEWLAQWEDSVCAVIAGWVTRAYLAKLGEARAILAGENLVTITTAQVRVAVKALEDAEGYRRLRADQWCGNCETAPAGACDDHLNDLDLADAYRGLADELARAGGRP